MNEDLKVIRQAEELIQAGEKAKAQKMLEPYIETHLHDVEAWLLEAETWPTIEGKIKVLELCLRHNRGNIAAKLELESLRSTGKSTFPERPTTAPVPNDLQETAPPAVAPRGQSPVQRLTNAIRQRIQSRK